MKFSIKDFFSKYDLLRRKLAFSNLWKVFLFSWAPLYFKQ